ncbi:MAG: hypothetical protein ACHQUC_00440 [Chlamydiales bacterium]
MINSTSFYCRQLIKFLPAIQGSSELNQLTPSALRSCFNPPQARSSSTLCLSAHSFKPLDLNWGFFDANLRKEGRSSQEISTLKEEFSSQVMDPNQPVSDRMKELYKKIFPKDSGSQIELIKKELHDQLKSLFSKISTNPSDDDETFLADFELEFVNQLKMMSALGKTDYLMWYLFQKTRLSSAEGRRSFAQALLSDSWARCRTGQPAVFAMMPLLLHERVIDSEAQGLVSRFSTLGVEEVRDDLSKSLVYGSTAYNPTMRSVPQDLRLERLRDLALAGHPLSQNQYAGYLFHNDVGGIFGRAQFDIKERLSEFKILIDRETETNDYVTRFYAFNGSEHLDAQLSVEERISKLEMRANKGDKQAFTFLLNAYKNNFLYRFSPSRSTALNLTEQERWEKIWAMRSIDPMRWNCHLQLDYLKGFIEPEFGRPCIEIPLSIEERYAWILENAFTDLSTDQAAVQLLRHQLKDEDKMPRFETFKDRLKGLFTLALKGSSQANEEICILIEWHNHGTDLPFEKSELFEMLTSLALAGHETAQWGVVKTILQTYWRLRCNGVAGLSLDPADYAHVLREIAWSSRNQNLSLEIIKLYFNTRSQSALENLIKLRDALR